MCATWSRILDTVTRRNPITLFRLIGERIPVLRSSDLLTEDHPDRPYPVVQRVRTSALIRALVFLAVFFVAMILWTSLDFMVVGSVSANDAGYALAQMASVIVAYVVLTFAMEARVWPYEIEPRRLLGLVKGMLLGAVVIAACVGILALAGVYSVTGVNSDYSPWLDLLLLGVAAGVTEEIQMRGAVFRLTEEFLGTWGAVAVSALAFGLMHLSNANATLWGAIAIALEAGILLAAVYVLTRSLWWCIGVHFAWNIVEGPVFGSIVSASGTQNSWLIGSWTGPEILTGGQFGLEASIVPVILSGGLGVALLLYAWRKGLMVAPMWTRKKKLTS